MSRKQRLLTLVLTAGAACAMVIVLVLVRKEGQPAIRFAYQNRVGSATCIVAVEKRFFADEGLAVEAFRFNSGPACSEALVCGSADIGTMGDTTAVIATSRGVPVTIIASHASGEHRHRLVVRPGLSVTPATDLIGKRIGVKKGTSTYGGFLAFLAARQIDPASVRIIDMRPADMPEALAAGSVDAFVASEPTPSLAEARGAREAATLGGLGSNYPLLVLARNDLLAKRGDDVRCFLRALYRAELFVKDHPAEASRILAEATGLTPEVARRAMQRHSYTLTLDSTIIASLEQTAGFLKSQGIIEEPPDFELVTNPEYLNP